MSEPTRIFYVCSSCLENAPEASGQAEPTDLRVMDDGRWLCNCCYDEEADSEAPRWSTLPIPPTYGPLPSVREK